MFSFLDKYQKQGVYPCIFVKETGEVIGYRGYPKLTKWELFMEFIKAHLPRV